MKLLILPDLHITERQPENRSDIFEKTALDKLKFIIRTARRKDVDAILQPGDLTDSPFMSWSYFIEVCEILREFKKPILCVYGQHDLRYRTKGNTVLDAITASCDNVMTLDGGYTLKVNGQLFVGSSYGEDIPEADSDAILLIHRMIISSKKIWGGQEDITWAKNFLRKNEFKLIVSGDNHASFITEYDNRFLFNSGCLLRDSVDLIEHEPYLILFDTETNEYEQIYVPIKPAEKVFNMDKIQEEKDMNKKIKGIVENLEEYKHLGLSFKENLFKYAKKNKTNGEVIDFLKKGFEVIGNEKNSQSSC